MKTILVATDFSPASRSAAEYAAQLAKSFHARLVLLSIYQPIPIVGEVESIAILGSEEMRELTQDLLKKEVAHIISKLEVHPEVRVELGSPANTILSVATEISANLIIVGMKRLGKRSRKLFGSTVTWLLNHSSIPLLVIPEDTSFTTIKIMAIASETDIPSSTGHELVSGLKEIAERFHSKLYIIRSINKDFSDASQFSSRPGRLFKMLRTLDPLYESFEAGEPSTVLMMFAKCYQVNLLVMLPGKHTPIERWFRKSVTREMIFESKIPLLILPAGMGRSKTKRFPKRVAHSVQNAS